MSRHRLLPLLVLAGLAGTLLTGCAYEESICSDGEYPVLAVGGAGSACVKNGQEPDKGWSRYPAGKVPEKVGDKWDEYWQTRTLDENGKVIPAPSVQ